MSSVDNRLVKMTFDNADFEKRAGTTLGTLDKLKQSLNFSGALKGMDNIQASANGVSFDRLSEGIEALQSRFSVLGEFVHNIFENIVTTAFNTGKQIAESLTIEPIRDGFAEYETQMNAVQTILANVRDEGKGLNDVTTALDELNTYADKTIYNFTEMTRNIGTFTAAGVDLNTSVNAIQGIANLAAVSGASSNDASRAMYQLSQALAAGVVHLQDWNSVQNANIGGETFQKAIEETAILRGALTQEQIDTAGSFRALLNAQDYGDWFSADILLESLEKFTAGSEGITKEQLQQMQELYRARGYTEEQIKSLTEAQHVLTEEEIEHNRQIWRDRGYTEEQIDGIMELGRTATDAATKVKTFHQLIDTVKETLGSGWTKSFEYIIGDFEQAKELWTEINDILSIYINASAEARNTMLKEWNESADGRAAVIDGLRNAFQALLGVLLPLKQAFDTVFKPLTSQDLIDASVRFRDFTETLKITDAQAIRLRETARKAFEIVKAGLDGVKQLGQNVIDIFKAVFEAIRNALDPEDFLAIGEIVERFKQLAQALKPSETVLTNIVKFVTGVISVFRALYHIAIDVGSALFDSLGKVFQGLAPHGEKFMDLLGQIGDWLTKFADALQKSFNYDAFIGGFDSMTESLKNFIDQIIEFTHLDDVIDWFKRFFTLGSEGEESFQFIDEIVKFFGKIADTISNFVSSIDLSKVDILAVLEGIFSVGSAKRLYDLINTLYEKFKQNAGDVPGLLQNLKKDIDDLIKSLIENLNTIKVSLVDTLSAIQTSVNTTALLKIAIAIGILVAALSKLASIDNKSLISAMLALTALMAEITFMTIELSKIKVGNIDGLSSLSNNLIKIAAAIFVLAAAVKDLAEVDPESLGRGLGAITVLLIEMVMVAERFAKMEGNLDKSIGSLIKFAAALWVIAKVVKDLAEVPADQLVPAMLGLTVIMAELTAVAIALSNSNLVKKPEQLTSVSKGLILFAVAVKIIASIVKDFAEIAYQDLAAGILGLVAVVAALGIVAAALTSEGIAKHASQLSTVSTGLILFAVAVKILASIVKDFAEIDYADLAVGLLGLITIVATLAIAAKALSSKDMKGLNDAALGMAVFIGGVQTMANIVIALGNMDLDQIATGIFGLVAVMGGLVIVAKLFSDKTMDPVKIVAVSGALLVFAIAVGGITASLAVLANLPFAGLVAGIIAIVAVIGLFAAAASLLQPLIVPMLELAGAILVFGAGLALAGVGIGVAAAGLAMLVGAFAAAGITITEVVRGLLDLIAGFGAALAQSFLDFITYLADNGPVLQEGIRQLFELIIITIGEVGTLLISTLLELLTQLLESIAEHAPRMFEAALTFINEFLRALAENIGSIVDSAVTIIVTFIETITQRLPEIVDAGFKLIISFINSLADAIRENHNALFDAIGNLITAIVEAIIDGVTKVGQAAGDLIFGEGGILEHLGNAVNDLFNAGADLVQGFIDGISSMPGQLWDAATSLATDAWNAVTGALDEHSPSRLTFGGGANFVLGFINGIESLRYKAALSAGAVAFAAMEAFNDNIDTDTIYSPTITPVIDASEIQNGISNMSTMFDSIPATYNITEDIEASNALQRQMFDIASQPSDYSTILNRMDSLEQSFESMIDRLGNLSIVMDSGELVGAIATPMDDALGMRQMMISRGAVL